MSLYVTSMLTQKQPEAQEAGVNVHWQWFQKSFSKWGVLALKARGSFKYQNQNQVAASAFLSTSQYLRHALELCSSDLYCNGRASFTPSLITTLDFILKMFSVYAPVSQILFQNSSKDCNPCRSPYKSYDWISWQHPLRCCWLIFVLLKVRKFAQIRKPSLLLNNQPNLHPDTSVENLTAMGQRNLTVLPKALCKTKWSFIFFRLFSPLHNSHSILIIFWRVLTFWKVRSSLKIVTIIWWLLCWIWDLIPSRQDFHVINPELSWQ